MPAQALMGASLVGAGAVATFVGLFVAGAIDAYLLGALFGSDLPSDDLKKLNLNIRSSSEAHKIIYGRSMTGGTVVFLEVLDRYYLEQGFRPSSNSEERVFERRASGTNLNMAIAVAAHEVDAIEQIWVGEDKVFELDSISGKLNLVSSKYKDYIEVIAFNGNQTTYDTFIKANVDKHFEGKYSSGATDAVYYAPLGVTSVNVAKDIMYLDTDKVYDTSSLMAFNSRIWEGGKDGAYVDYTGIIGDPGGTVPITYYSTDKGARPVPIGGLPWKTTYKLTNTAYIYLRFVHNSSLYKSIPKIRTVLRGKKVYDPRWAEVNLTVNDTGTWAPSTVYSINDKIADPNGKEFICQRAHTSNGTVFSTSFENDFIIEKYWKQNNVANDPDTWEWSDNWATCLRDYLTSGNYHSVSENVSYTKPINLYGIGIKETEISDSNVIEAANVSDEKVYLQTSTESVVASSYSTSTGVQTVHVTGNVTDYYVKYETIEVTTAAGATLGESFHSGVVPVRYTTAPIAALLPVSYNISESLYYITSVYYNSGTGRTVISFKANQDLSPTAIRIWSDRFTVNGIVDTAQKPIDVIEGLLASGAGKLPYVQGKFLIIPGVYITPTITIDESILAGPINVHGSLGSAELTNTVTGTIREAANVWEEIDFVTQSASSYIAADGGYQLIKNVKYPFIDSNFDAQRLARINLQRAREGVSCSMVCNLLALELSVGNFINVNIDRLGWTNKVFSITSWSLQDNTVILGLREENSVAYDWTDVLLTPIEYSPDTEFEVSPDLDPITNLTLASGTDQLIALADGTIVPRVYVTWTAPDQDVQTYLTIKYSIKPFDIDDDVVVVKEIRINDPSLEEFYIDEVREGDVIDLEASIRYDDPNVPISGDTAYVTNHVVVGKTEPPADITGLVGAVTENLLVLSWDVNTEIDFDHYEIREGASWDLGTLVDTTLSTSYIVTYVTIGSINFWVKAIDTSGNESTTAANVSPNIVAPSAIADVVYSIQQNSIALSWGAAPAGTFPVASYEIRYGADPVFTNNTLVAVLSSTDYIINNTFTGTRTYRVVAKDIYKNSGPQTTEVITINTPNAPSINPYTINGDKVEFTWSTTVNPLTQFPIESYEIAYGTDPVWDNNTFILTTGTDGFSRRVDWLTSIEATRTFRVRGIDHVGNAGSVSTVDVSITEPGATTVSQQVIDNNVLLTWSEPTIHDLPIDKYEIRKGDTYGTSDLVGEISGLFAAIFETIAGTFTYWVTAVDTAGNPSPNNSVTASVNEPPDYTLLVNGSDDFATTDSNWLSRTFTNAYVTPDSTLLMPVDTTQTWATHFTNNSWTDIEDQVTAGFPIYIQPTPASGHYDVVYDIGTIVTNLSVTQSVTASIVAGDPVTTLGIETAEYNVIPAGTVTTPDVTGITLTDTSGTFLTETSVGSLVTNTTDGSTGVIASITDDNNLVLTGSGLSGGSDNQWDSADAYTIDNWISRGNTTDSSLTVFVNSFRYVRTNFDVASAAADNDIWEATIHNIIIDVKEKTDSGTSITNGSGTTTVTLNKSFYDLTSIVITPNIVSGDSIIAVYDFTDVPNPTTFDVYTFDETGAAAATIDFSWVVRGY